MDDELTVEGLVNPRKRRMGRRAFLKSMLKGTVLGAATYGGLELLGNYLSAIAADADREIRRFYLDIKALSGTLDTAIQHEIDELKSHYTGNRLEAFLDADIAKPDEIYDLKILLEKADELNAHYTFRENLRIFKDRLDNRILKIEENKKYVQKGIRWYWNKLGEVIGVRKPGREGELQQEAFRKYIAQLCKVYDTNEDNRAALREVYKKINEDLETVPDLLPEQRAMMRFIKDKYEEAQKDPNKQTMVAGGIKDFILNYERFEAQNEQDLGLREYITMMENFHTSVASSMEYAKKLHTALEEGFVLVDDLRKAKAELKVKSEETYRKYEAELRGRVDTLRSKVDEIIAGLEHDGYGNIVTREEFINSGKYATRVREFVSPLAAVAGIVVGVSSACRDLLHYIIHKDPKAEARAYKGALEEAVDTHNSLLQRYNRLKGDLSAD